MTPPADTEDDPRLLAAVQEYLAELEAGRRPERRAFVARHPEFADALGPYLDALDALNAVAPQLPASPPPKADPGPEPLGDFRIVREIGRGGMGVVYEAVQLSLGRRVALKVLPFAAALNAKQLQRFKTEAHAAAQLHHTNIVPVYAVGCERGMHFYAMQVIDGRPLDEVIREARGEGGAGPAVGGSTVEFRAGPTVAAATGGTARTTGRGREAYRTAARIAAQVADALEYAHDAGVVHRDVKPANLLLDAKGNVWVTDFGLAQVTADVGLTQTGDVFGTLRYMSPEQAAGRRVDVDHRTDVYSLGATLYELLTLEPVFPGHDRQRVLHQVLHEEPRPPRQVDRAVPVELETIVLKALAKAPADRYATAGEMAADLRRFLADQPILARRPSAPDRARKWVRRHPSAVGAAVVVLALGVVGLAVSTLLVAREKDRAQAAYGRELQRANEAEQRFALARRAADEMVRLAEEETAGQPHLEGVRKRLLESALAYYQEFIELRRDDPTAQADLTAARDKVKQVLGDLAALQGDRHLSLLADPAVHDDLRLTDEQRGRVAELFRRVGERRHEAFREFHRLTAEERERRFVEQARANEAAVAAVLAPAQVRRLRQIALQVRGPMVFRDADVVAALKLTPEQRDRVREIEARMLTGRGDVIWFRVPHDGGPLRPPGPPRESDIRQAMQAILEVFTPQQRAKWTELTGEPFAGLRNGGPFGSPRPPGPGPRVDRFRDDRR